MAVKTQKTKKKESVGTIIFRCCLCAILLSVSFFFWSQIVKDVKTNHVLQADLNDAQAELKSLQTEKSDLQNQKDKLSDANYISSVARGKYLISTSNEQIYVLPSLDE